MTRLLITRGLPGVRQDHVRPQAAAAAWSGSTATTCAGCCTAGGSSPSWAEGQVTHAQRAAVEALLRAHADVIVDDTNLRGQDRTRVGRAGRAVRGAASRCTTSPTYRCEECIRRDADRPASDRVGEDGDPPHARRATWPASNLPLPVPFVDRAARDWSTTPTGRCRAAVLVDIDGTVALMGGRSPYDWTRVGEDLPEPGGDRGRPGHARGRPRDRLLLRAATTVAAPRPRRGSTCTSACPYEALFMRPAGDSRKDSIVKRGDLRRARSATGGGSSGVFDDRQQVVRMWRALGLTVFQVAEGDF